MILKIRTGLVVSAAGSIGEARYGRSWWETDAMGKGAQELASWAEKELSSAARQGALVTGQHVYGLVGGVNPVVRINSHNLAGKLPTDEFLPQYVKREWRVIGNAGAILASLIITHALDVQGSERF